MNTYLYTCLQSFFIVFCIMLMLEFAGRKSLSQFTMIQAVVVIAIGEAIFLPISDQNFGILRTLLIIATLIIFMILMEWLEIKFNFLEKLFTKRAVKIIENGKLNIEVLKKNRMSVDQLEIKLRSLGISNYEELKEATIEANGQIGYNFKDEFKPITRIEMLQILGRESEIDFNKFKGNDMFEEITEGHSIKHEERLK